MATPPPHSSEAAEEAVSGSRIIPVFDMLTDRLGSIETLLGRLAASSVRNDDLKKADAGEFSGLLHCGRAVDVLKSYDYDPRDVPCLYNITINDGDTIDDDAATKMCVYYCSSEWARGEEAGQWDKELASAWGASKLADVRRQCACVQEEEDVSATCLDVGLPADGHKGLNSHILETVVKTKVPELVALGEGCIVRGRHNSTVAELLAIAVNISDELGYDTHFGRIELQRVPNCERLVSAIVRGNRPVAQAEYDALPPRTKNAVKAHEFFEDRGLDM